MSRKPALDVKHLFKTVRMGFREEGIPYYYIELPPFGEIRLLLQDDMVVGLVDDEGDQRQYHSHYGKIKYHLLEGRDTRMQLGRLCEGAGAMIGVDGWLRVTGNGEVMSRCIHYKEDCPEIWYIKPYELFIFPKKAKS